MLSIVFILLSTMAFASAVVLTRRRLDESTFFSASFVITIVGNIFLWPLVLLSTNFQEFSFGGVIFFAIAGIISYGITRLIYYKGMEIVGVTVNSAIFATVPIYSIALAVLLLHEPIIITNWIGTICIIIGAIYLERSLSKPSGSKKFDKRGLVFPLLAAFSLAFAMIFRKYGLNIYNEPIFGAAIGYGVSFPFYILLLLFFPSTRVLSSLGRDFRLFWKAGVCMSLGSVLIYYALSFEKISIVSPLKQLEPLFVLLFTHYYLRELEHITYEIVIGTIIVIIGGIFVTIS